MDKLRRAGVEVIDFGAGEPDFGTPDAIKDAAHQALDAEFTKYTPVPGIAELRRAVCDRYKTDYGVEYTEPQVILTAGGKQALYNTALTLFGPGDEVITHQPYWPTIVEQIKLADATPVAVETRPEDGFAIRADAILRAITPRTRGHRHQLAVQSDRRADFRRGPRRDRRRGGRNRTSGWSWTSATRS